MNMERLFPTELEDFEDYTDYDYEEFYTETVYDVWENCILPSVLSVKPILLRVIGINLIFGVLTSLIKLPQTMFHICSTFTGIYLIWTLESTVGKVTILAFFSTSYLLLHLRINPHIKKYESEAIKVKLLSNGNIVQYSLFTVLVLCEYFILDTNTWLEIRGVIMVFSMKLISLAKDVDTDVIPFPTVSQYFGYVFCGADVLFGPWISFQQYIVLFNYQTKKSIWWIFGIIKAVVISVSFLLVSNCIISYIIRDNANRWLIAYKEAFTFRTSHYFVCYLSEASMLAAGYKNQMIWDDTKKWQFTTTDPLKIEFPTALSIVVTYWNRPMHNFLKKYIYKAWLPLGKFYAILVTFIASSCLHGFEIKVSVVLISIGIFSYIQFVVRNYFANTFHCCIRVYPCANVCIHKYKRSDIRCRVCQVVFRFFTMLHLVYLGMLMDSSTDNIGIYEKWKSLYFISFWIMLFDILIIM